MNMRYLVLAAALLLPLQGCGRRGAAVQEPFVRSALSLLQSKSVTRLEILYFSRHAETEIYERKLNVENFLESSWKPDIIRALEDPHMKRVTGPVTQPDCRWACVFYDAKGIRVLTMYFDGHGWKGLIAGTPVAFTGRFGKLRLVALLENRCLPSWE
jgi:hypothetical protein